VGGPKGRFIKKAPASAGTGRNLFKLSSLSHFIDTDSFEVITSAISIPPRDILPFQRPVFIDDVGSTEIIRCKPEKAG
jgi:hypothetical protein